MKLVIRSLLALLLFVSSAGASLDQVISENEFRQLAAELAPKVNLFQEVWRQDPSAEFFGGTSRDYLYWLKGQLRGVQNRSELETRIQKLKGRPFVDIREIIIGESDVDVVTQNSSL